MVRNSILRKILDTGQHADFVGDLREVSFEDGKLRRATTHVLCFVTIGLTGFTIALNVIQGNYELVVPLCIVVLFSFIALTWLWIKKSSELGPLYLCLSVLIALGGFLLLQRGAPDGSSLFWYLLFPPMLMFCLGLRRGTIVFWCFWFFLLLLMVPFQDFLAAPLPATVRIRFLGAMVGAFVFSWGTEYTRFQVQKTLARTMARLEVDSLTDPLTGLGNRRDFYNFYSIYFLNTPAHKQAFAIAIMDIDNFKVINDTFGHEMGDRVLCHVADILQTQCRETDKLYRWGGEEFLILMPRTTAVMARQVLERMRDKLEKTPYCDGNDHSIALTASFGLCEGSAEKKLERQITSADSNLYTAKREGRNRVVGPENVA